MLNNKKILRNIVFISFNKNVEDLMIRSLNYIVLFEIIHIICNRDDSILH